MSINLNEFTREQLEFYISVFKETINDINYNIQQVEGLPLGDLRHDLSISYEFELDSALLMRIQLENALNEVKNKEREFFN